MSGRTVARGAALLALVAFGSCDSGPSGPGTLTGTVRGENLGAVVLDVIGSGIQGFEGRGGTQAYSAPVVGAPNRHRVVLIDAPGGELRFGVDVDDLDGEAPTISVVSAAGTDDAPRLTADIEVFLER